MPYKDPEKRREANRRYQHESHLRNPQRQVARNKERIRRSREWIEEYKSKIACAQCGENHPACLDFHHTDPAQKEYSIATIHRNGLSRERLEREIRKCTVLCSNCHRKLHWNERNEAGIN